MNLSCTISLCKWEISREGFVVKICSVLLSGKLGDGGIYKSSANCFALYVSVNLDYLQYKHNVLVRNGIKCADITTQNSGYKQGAKSYTFRACVHPTITRVHELSISKTISILTKRSLIQLYLDDGSFHKKKHFMHIYCNTFTVNETEQLADKIFELYPIKRPSLRWDKKKDGRKYPYLYIPTTTAREMREDVLEFLQKHNINSLMYKTGYFENTNPPSTTIENVGDLNTKKVRFRFKKNRREVSYK
jgi:hypothetical protein